MIGKINTDYQELSELQIGLAIILGLLLFLFCCEISFVEDQKFMSQYSIILQTHESIMLMSRQYKQLFQEYRNFTRLLYEVVVKINNKHPTLHRTVALVNMQKEVYPETQGTIINAGSGAQQDRPKVLYKEKVCTLPCAVPNAHTFCHF